MSVRASLSRLLCLSFTLFIFSLSAWADLPAKQEFLVPEGEPLSSLQELRALRLGKIGQLVYSHDGNLLAAAAENGRVCLWLISSPRPAYCLPQLNSDLRVTALAFGPNDDWIAIGYNDGRVDLRSTASDRPIEPCHYHALPAKLAMGRPITSLLFPVLDDSLLAIGTNGGTGRRWKSPFSYGVCRSDKDIERDDPKPSKGLPRGLFDATALDPAGRHLAIATGTALGVWDTFSGEKRWSKDNLPSVAISLAISLDGRHLAAGFLNGAVYLIDVQSGQIRQLGSPHRQAVRAIAFAPDGRSFAAGSDDRHVSIWTVSSTKLPLILARRAGISALAFRPDGAVLAVSSQDVGVTLFDTATYEEHQALRGSADLIRSVAFSPKGRFLATASEDFAVRVWERNPSQSSEPQWVLRCSKKHDGMLSALAFQPPDDRLLAVAGESHLIRLIDVSKQDCPDAGLLEDSEATAGWQNSLSFSSDGRWLATGSDDGSTWVWDAQTWKPKHRLAGHRDSVSSVAFSPIDSTLLATGSYDKTARLWDVSSGILHHTFESQSAGIKALAISPDGMTLAMAAARKVSLWNLTDRRLLGRLVHGEVASAVCFSSDSKLLATTERKGKLRLWDLASQKEQTSAELLEKDESEPILALAADLQSHALAAAALGRVIFWEPQVTPHIQRVLWQGNQGWATWVFHGEGGKLFRNDTGGLLLRQRPGGTLSLLEPPRPQREPQLDLKVTIERGKAWESSTAVATVENVQPAGPALWLRWELNDRPGDRNFKEQFHFRLPADQMRLEPGAKTQVRIPISLRSRWWPPRSLECCLGIRPLYGNPQTVCKAVAIGPWWWQWGPELLFSSLVVASLIVLKRHVNQRRLRAYSTSSPALAAQEFLQNQISPDFIVKVQTFQRVEEQTKTQCPHEPRDPRTLRKAEEALANPSTLVRDESDHPPVYATEVAMPQRWHEEHRCGRYELGRPCRLLLHYAPEDAAHAAEFRKHLSPLVREGLVEILAPLLPGVAVVEGHQRQLREADALLALVSADYLAADDSHELLRQALRFPQGELFVVPVLVREASITGTLFAGRKLLPEDGRAVSAWPSSDAAWKNVAVGVRLLISSAVSDALAKRHEV